MPENNNLSKKFNELRNNTWVRIAFFIGIPLLMIKIVNPEWLGRVISYISLFAVVVVLLIRELLRTNYDHVTIFDPKTKKVVLAITRILGFVCLLLLLYGSLNYGKDILFLMKNKKPVEASGVVTEYRATAYTGFGLLGQFLDIKITEEEEDQDFTLVLHSIVRKGSYIKFYYLPNSKLIVQTFREENREEVDQQGEDNQVDSSKDFYEILNDKRVDN